LPSFRQNIEATRQTERDGSYCYVLTDQDTGEVYELGDGEYFICTKLDGMTRLPDVQKAFKAHYGVDLTMEHLEAFINQISRMGLLEDRASRSALFLSEVFMEKPPERWKNWHLFYPDRFLRFLTEQLSWLYTRTFVAMSGIVLILAIGVLYNNYHRFLAELRLIFEPLTFFQVVLMIYCCFNIPAQLVRGITAIYYDGYVDAFGLRLNFNFLPTFYCENNVWMGATKSGRGWILFAPTYYSLFVASLGLLCWSMTTPASALHTFGLALFFIGSIYAAIRLNFLWPSDAAYLLANWLDIPDLRRRSIDFTKAWMFRQHMPEALTSREARLFKWYGFFSMSVTLLSVAIALYYISKWMVLYLGGTGAVILLLVVMIKYRHIFAAAD
jgi:putative peptide zinc metalloprotease protein